MFAIRHLHIDPGLVLAPMEGVTDLSFRRLVRSIGAVGLTVTEFIPGRSLAEGHKNALKMAEFDPDERPVSVQVYGRDPAVLADAARYVEQELGADIVDLNMGCPSKKVCKNSGGSALMREPELAQQIVKAMRAAVSIPFTVKMRAGWDASLRNAPEIAAMCEGEGAEMVAVHWRTRADLYKGERDLSIIRRVKEAVRIPVLANGDIVDEDSAMNTLAETGCDGLMIGRGAIRDPWVFKKIVARQQGLSDLTVDLAERKRVLVEFYGVLERTSRTEKGALGRMKKIGRYFTEGVPRGDELRQAIFHAQAVQEVFDRIAEHFAQLDREDTPPLEAGSQPTAA
ncbi:MAG: tRNA dihydrouridine synthase DusB [Myxococcota bacterium]